MRQKIKNNQTFTARIRDIVKQIPAGETRSYKEVAELAGAPQAARAVGRVMSQNYDPTVPCHRVIRSDGTIGEYNRGGKTQKEQLLAAERYTMGVV